MEKRDFLAEMTKQAKENAESAIRTRQANRCYLVFWGGLLIVAALIIIIPKTSPVHSSFPYFGVVWIFVYVLGLMRLPVKASEEKVKECLGKIMKEEKAASQKRIKEIEVDKAKLDFFDDYYEAEKAKK